ncbi:phage head morphogenesis protein [Nitratireductor rhodophyticola]
MSTDDLFKTAPDEVVRYFRAKRSLPSFDWRDVAPEEHAFSWTVAKSMENDILEDIRSAVDDAIVNRVPFETFQQQLTPILQQKGWWGRHVQEDPKDGALKVVQLGSPRRLRTIYWANTRTAHAAGEWERTQRNKRFLPFLLYTLSRAERRRKEHEGWVGIVLPVDDPWWDTHYPPNGWGCQCGVRQISEREARRLGWEDGMEGPQVIMRSWKNKRSGTTELVPMGIDPGWASNPGKHRALNASEFLYGKLSGLTESRRRVAIEDIVGSPLMHALAEQRVPKGSFLPVAQLSRSVVQAADARTSTVRLSVDSASHILHEHAARGLDVSDFREAVAVLTAPAAVVRSSAGLVVLGIAGGKWWKVALKLANDRQEWWLVSFHRKKEKAALSAIRSAKKGGRIVE